MKKLLFFAVALSAFLTFTVSVGAQEWYDEAWHYRVEVTIENLCSETLTGYQVQVLLDSSFALDNALPDGSDLRVTDSDGITLIPFWIEEWDYMSSASIWVKVPSMALEGATIYLYYGNQSPPGPQLVEVPPTGMWQKHPDNPVYLIDDPGSGDVNGLLAENMVYDNETGKYWLLFADYRTTPYTIGLAWSVDPGNPDAWYWYEGNPIITAANAPHIMKHDGKWYVFFADNSYGWPFGVSVSESVSSDIRGPYNDRTEVLAPGANYCLGTPDWDAARVDEPYVFQYHGDAVVDSTILDGKWILVYMGDQWGYPSNCGLSPGVTEQIGYAYADEIDGVYTKFSGNPIIPFGLPGEFDSGTVADPWVYEFNGTYYIGYVGAPNKAGVPADTAYVTTTDWINFSKHPINLPVGPTGSWDSDRAFRGAVSRFGDTYYLPYTGRNSSGVHRMGMATQPALVPEPLNDANEVFEFYDGFDGDALDMTKWVVKNYNSGGVVTVGSGQLTITAQVIGSTRGYVQMRGTTPVPTGTLLETYAEHPEALQSIAAAEVGFKGANLDVFSNVIRIWDDPGIDFFTLQAASPLDGGPGPVESGFEFANYPPDLPQTYRLYRSTLGTAEFQIDDSDFDVLSGAYIPTGQMYGWLMSYAQPPATESRFVVDWLRIRKWCGLDALAELGEEEQYTIEVAIDVKPGSDTNSINLGSKGVIPVAILSTADFDATTVDPGTVTLGGFGVALRGKASKLMAHEEDVNGDGLIDLVVQVETENFDESSFQDGSVVLEGETYGGKPIRGSDEITIVPPESS